ncbi:transcription factor SOX-30 isoform X2, partial [Clarias magur]
MNAYIIWARKQRSVVAKAYPNASAAEVSEQLGIKWRKLSEDQKMPYYLEASRLKWEHSLQFPDWEYKPHRQKRKQVCPDEAAPETSAIQNNLIFSDHDLTPHHQKRKQVGLEVTSPETPFDASPAKAQALLQRSMSLEKTASPRRPDREPTPPHFPDDLLSCMPEPLFIQTSTLDFQETSIGMDLYDNTFLDYDDISALDQYLFGDLKTSKGKGRNSHIRRPMNPYIIWARKHRSVVAEAYPNASAAEVSEQLGIEWRKLSEDQKMPYYLEASRLKWEHSLQFPDWEYKPRPKKRKQVCLDKTAPETSTIQNNLIFS